MTPTPSCPFCGIAPRQMANHAVACGFVVCCETPACPLDNKYVQLDAWSRRAKPAESALHKAARELEHFMSAAVRAESLELKADDVGADGLTERLNALREALSPAPPIDEAAEREAALEDIDAAIYDINNCDWSCTICGHDYGMHETDLANSLARARAKLGKP